MPGDKYLSPTAIKKWLGEGDIAGCPRRWGFNYLIPNNREIAGPAAEFGSEVHAVLERYVRDGIQPNVLTRAGALAEKGLYLLPKPKTVGVYTELEFRFLWEGITFGGKRDLWDTSPLFSRNVPVLYDHKTCSDPRRALKPSTLSEDTAAIIYALGSMSGSSCQEILLRWIYFVTRDNPRVIDPPTECHLDFLPTLRRFEEKILPASKKIWPLYTDRSVVWTPKKINSELDYCRAACHIFGRDCPYLGTQCAFPGSNAMSEVEDRVAQMNALIASKRAGGAAAAPAPAAPAADNAYAKALAAGYPENIATALAHAPESTWEAIASAMGFDAAAAAAAKAAVLAAAKVAAEKAAAEAAAAKAAATLPKQAAPVNPPEASLETLATAKDKKGKGSAATSGGAVQLPLDLKPGESATYQIVVTRLA